MTCCGAGDIHEAKPDYYLHLNARILGQAEALGIPTILTICNVCTLNLRQANKKLQQDPAELERVNRNLAEVGAATYSGGVDVRHLLWEVSRGRRLRALQGDRGALARGAQGRAVLRLPDPAPVQAARLRGPRPPAVARAPDRGLRRRGRSTTRPRSSAAASRSCWRARTSRWARPCSRWQQAVDAGADVIVTPCPLCHLSLDAWQQKAEKKAGPGAQHPDPAPRAAARRRRRHPRGRAEVQAPRRAPLARGAGQAAAARRGRGRRRLTARVAVRVAALADLHGRLDGVVVPPCDLVVIAGDLAPYAWKQAPNQVPWLEAFFAPWLERVAAEAGAPVVGIAGNRDFAWWWDRRVFERLPWTYLLRRGGDASAGCACTARPGARGAARGRSPTSRSRPRRRCRRARGCRDWPPRGRGGVFMAGGEDELAAHFEAIPEGIDVLVTHTPPQGHGDLTSIGDHVGSQALLAAIERAQPPLAVFGHIHEGRGEPTRVGADAVRQLGDLRSLVRAAQPAVALRHRSRGALGRARHAMVSEYSLGLLRCARWRRSRPTTRRPRASA